jgi:hypothetical protein
MKLVLLKIVVKLNGKNKISVPPLRSQLIYNMEFENSYAERAW